ncbi:MAG: hypothetical protein FJX92_02910 [Bacteroidetes bacterium]|nr:hypothetical protein [Bacteroidota bacterium]
MQLRLLFFSLLLSVSFVMSAQSSGSLCEMYAIRDRVYFYDRTYSAGRTAYVKRKAYLVYGDRFWITCSDYNNDWVYITFRNQRDVVTRGYIRNSDMKFVR